jgi:hypothetical protein
MQIGVVYPQTELRGDPTAVRRIGTAVEDLGFDYLLAYDHVLGAVHADRTPRLTGPYTEQDPFHDPFVMFAFFGRHDRAHRVRHRDSGPSAAPDSTRGAASGRC